MTEIEARLLAQVAATQSLAVAATGLLFAMSNNDPDLSKAKAVLQILEADQASGLAHLPEPVQDEAKAVLSDLCNRVILRASDYRQQIRQ